MMQLPTELFFYALKKAEEIMALATAEQSAHFNGLPDVVDLDPVCLTGVFNCPDQLLAGQTLHTFEGPLQKLQAGLEQDTGSLTFEFPRAWTVRTVNMERLREYGVQVDGAKQVLRVPTSAVTGSQVLPMYSGGHPAVNVRIMNQADSDHNKEGGGKYHVESVGRWQRFSLPQTRILYLPEEI